MPYYPHTKITFLGSRGEAPNTPRLESWSIGLRFASATPSSQPTLSQVSADELAVAAVAPASTLFSSELFSQNSFLEEVRVYNIGTNGKSFGAIGKAPLPNPVVGGSGSYHAFQLALVTSLVAAGRSPGKFGRVYLPAPAAGVQGDGLISPSYISSMMGAMQTFLHGLEGLTQLLGQDLVVASQSSAGGSIRPVTELRIGRVMDTQRRRRRSLDEAYAVGAY